MPLRPVYSSGVRTSRIVSVESSRRPASSCRVGSACVCLSPTICRRCSARRRKPYASTSSSAVAASSQRTGNAATDIITSVEGMLKEQAALKDAVETFLAKVQAG